MSTRHFFTVDVEEHFQVSAFEDAVPRADWERLESRVAANVERLLDLLERYEVLGTFFTLGWVADRHPAVVRAIAGAGHEVASHGWGHQRITQLTPERFRDDVRRAKAALEDLTGVPVLGYRAPSFSIVPGREWALDILIEEGHRYDSSLFPIRRPGGYGFPDAVPVPHWLDRPPGRLLELPPATVSVAGMRLQAAGGAYFRIFPYGVVAAGLRAAEAAGAPGTFYLHPWELDPDQPRIEARLTSRLRHYTGLDRTEPRLERLLTEFRFGPIAAFLETGADAAVGAA